MKSSDLAKIWLGKHSIWSSSQWNLGLKKTKNKTKSKQNPKKRPKMGKKKKTPKNPRTPPNPYSSVFMPSKRVVLFHPSSQHISLYEIHSLQYIIFQFSNYL